MSAAVDYALFPKAQLAKLVIVLPNLITRSASVTLGQRTTAFRVLLTLVSKFWMSDWMFETMLINALIVSPNFAVAHNKSGTILRTSSVENPFGKHVDVKLLKVSEPKVIPLAL
ncbi:hypothetical protein L798_08854 [Zootermopsis nevadensis]|uniref:Uncharacterized protein n=1 Tax=Zootermopsis nevadensis TaxID=136037 RepID=A0A067R2R2_ZOONE|nr:hypothetical protein L798_08854 [Zootermopsis nevadensis]